MDHIKWLFSKKYLESMVLYQMDFDNIHRKVFRLLLHQNPHRELRKENLAFHQSVQHLELTAVNAKC